MPNPFVALAPAFEVLATEGPALPTKGQANTDLAIANPDESYDRADCQGKHPALYAIDAIPEVKSRSMECG